jgi:hypothetical protein
MNAPKVIWVEPGMPGYTDEPCKDYTKRYTRADAPELVALVEAAKASFAAFNSAGNVTERHLMVCEANVALESALSAYEAMQ